MTNPSNPKQPLVSILICNYNYGRFISTAIDSALAQTYPNIEIIVVDDGSKDNSREVIETYKDRVRAIFKPNGGQPSTFNVAFAASSGDIICLLDSDDYFTPDKVAKVVECYQNHPEVSFVFHPLRRIHISDSESQEIHEPTDFSHWLDYRNKTNKFSAPPTTGLSFRRSTWNTFVFIPEELTFLGDNYITFVTMALHPGFYLCEPLAVLRLHGHNMLSMDPYRISRLPEDVKVAFAMRRNFPALVKQADRLVSITVAKYWKLKLANQPIRIQLDNYLRESSLPSKLRIYAGAALRLAKSFASRSRSHSKLNSHPVPVSTRPAQSDPNSKLVRT
ncbi:MAG TPA: glycosyltransferase [Candidatus Acidoferrum sp.]|jgi:glycosyltransferase involved in cell wall biosynthesis